MKNKILLFIIGIMLAGCSGRQGNGGQVVAGADSIPKTKTIVSYKDSVFDPQFKKLLKQDSVELIAVAHASWDSIHPVEQIIYIDHHQSDSNLIWIKKNYADIMKGVKTGDLVIPDSVIHINNPYFDLNGAYLPVYKYKGQYIYSDFSRMSQEIIADNSIWEIDMGLINHTFISASRDNGKTIYELNFMGKKEELQIKKLNVPYGIQLWKLSDENGSRYELRLSIEKAPNLPWIVIVNNYNPEWIVEEPEFDHINYDSLMNSR